MSLVDSSLTAASVRVDQEAVVLAIPKPLLQSKLHTDASFAARFYRALSLFMANRMRSTIRRMGYGKVEVSTAHESGPDELDTDILGRVHLAGARFERMLKQLAGG